jgi:hypothetical protein
MRNADRPTQPPPNDPRPASGPAAPVEHAETDDADTRILFVSWDAPLVPDVR